MARNQLARLQVVLEAESSRLTKGLDDVNRRLSRFERSARTSLAGVASSFKGLFGAIAIGNLADSFLDVNRNVGVLRAQLESATGSIDAAALAYDRLQQFSDQYALDLGEQITAFTRLKNLGLDPSVEALTAYGNIASGTGKRVIDFAEAVADAVTGEFERLKEFGIRASKQGDEVQFTFRGITETVAFSSKEIERYLQDIGNVQFAGNLEKQALTLDASLRRLTNSFKQVAVAIGDAGVVSLLQSVADGINEVVGVAKAGAVVVSDFFNIGREVSEVQKINAEIKLLQTSLRDLKRDKGTFQSGRLGVPVGIEKSTEALRKQFELETKISFLQNKRQRLLTVSSKTASAEEKSEISSVETKDITTRIRPTTKIAPARIQRDELADEAERLRERLQTPLEAFRESTVEFKILRDADKIDSELYFRAVADSASQLFEAFDDQGPQIAFQKTVVELQRLRDQDVINLDEYSRAYAKAQEQFADAQAEANANLQAFGRALTLTHNPAIELAEDLKQIDAAFNAGFVDQSTRLAAITDEMEEFKRATQETSDELENFGESAFEKITSSLEEAVFSFSSLRDIARGLAQDLGRLAFREFVTEPLENAVSALFKQSGASGGGLFTSLLSILPGFATGGEFTVGPQTSAPIPGVDNRVVAFRARDGEKVTITRPGEPEHIGDKLKSLIKRLPGFATGGDFLVGPQTSPSIQGIDNRLVAFRARDGERVSVTQSGQSVGTSINIGRIIVQTPNVDSFASRESRTQMAEAIRRSAELAQRNI